ncbi:MAG: MFS transporter [Chloroflexota bacterium]|nr:MFS transporter [Chloroflexota bacterium]
MTSGFRVLSSGTILTALVLMFSRSHLVIGLTGAIPLLTRAAQLATPGLITRFGAARLTHGAGWLERLAFLGSALAAVARVPHALEWLFLGLAIGTTSAAVYDVGIASLGIDRVGAREQGAFFAIRTRWASILGVVAGIAGGLLIDQIEHHGVAPTTARGIVLIAGLVPASVAALALRRFASRPVIVDAADIHARPPVSGPPPAPRAPRYVGPDRRAANRPLRAILCFAAAWGFSSGLMVRHLDAYALNILGYSVGTLTVVVGLVAGMGAVGAMTWGRLADRFGPKPILVVATLLTAVNPMWYMLATSAHPLPYIIGQIISGLANAGWVIGVPLFLLNAPLCRSGEKVKALALFQATVGIASGVAPLVGGVLLDELAPLGQRHAYVALFAIAGLARLLAVRLLIAVPHDESSRTRYMAAVVWRIQSRRFGAVLASSATTLRSRADG